MGLHGSLIDANSVSWGERVPRPKKCFEGLHRAQILVLDGGKLYDVVRLVILHSLGPL